MEVGKFAGALVSVIVAILLVTALGIPVIQSAVGTLDAETDGDIITMLEVVPLLLVVAIIVGIVGMFISRRE